MAGVEGAFDLGVEMTEGRGGGGVPPRLFGEADAVFAADDAAHGKNTAEKFIQDAVHPTIIRFGASRSHQIDVNIPVPGMAKAGNGNPVFFLKLGGKPKEIENAAPRDSDILIQFNEAGIAQGVAKAATNLPKLLAGFFANGRNEAGGGSA